MITKKLLPLLCAMIFAFGLSSAAKKTKTVKISVEPKEAAIYINNTLAGYGYAEFTRPKKKKEVVIIRIECEEYQSLSTKFYGGRRAQLHLFLHDARRVLSCVRRVRHCQQVLHHRHRPHVL